MVWAILGEAVTGTSHRARNAPCQDAFRLRMFGPGAEWLLIAAADGAGSASHAEVGATVACGEFARRIETLGPDVVCSRDGMVALFHGVRATVLAEAERLDVSPRDLACTALLAVVGPSSAAFAQLGDGAIVIGQGDGHRVIFWPEPAEYANATDFLTDDAFADSVRFEVLPAPVTEVAVFTDGLQRLALDFMARTAYPAFFRPLFSELRSAENPGSLAEPLRNFLDSDRVNERTDDDKTLVLAVRRP
jgi:hypothetical protein